MSLKGTSGVVSVLSLIISSGLSPNQFYVLCCIRDGISPRNVNLHQEVRNLTGDGWITPAASDGYIISEKAKEIIKVLEDYTKSEKKVDTPAQMASMEENIVRYNIMFPAKKLPSGKMARSAAKNLEVNFIWFFKNHEYSWDTVFKATAIYLDQYESKNYLYMRTSQYFIRKMEGDRSFKSELADYCAIVESGEEPDKEKHFSDKAV